MANIKSAKKRIKTNEKARMRNKMKKSAMKTSMKKLDVLIVEGNKQGAEEQLLIVCKLVDKAASAGIVHKNYASRQKSRYAKKVNSI